MTLQVEISESAGVKKKTNTMSSMDTTPQEVTVETGTDKPEIKATPDQIRVLDTTEDNAFVLLPGETRPVNIPMSDRNRLLFKHNMIGLFDGSEVFMADDRDDNTWMVYRRDDGAYTIEAPVGKVRVSEMQEDEIVSAVADFYKQDSVRPIERLFNEIAQNQVPFETVEAILDESPFAELQGEGYIEMADDGILIYDRLLLTWENEFHHPHQKQYDRSGNLIDPTVASEAFDLQRERQYDDDEEYRRTLDLDGESVFIGQAVFEFITKILWAVETLR